MDRQKYFVNMQMHEIHKEQTPDSNEFEIEVTESERDELNGLFSQLNEEEKNALRYIVHYIDERQVDEQRKKYDQHVQAILEYMYDKGTDKTKQTLRYSFNRHK